jgi:hypothetical protein
MLILKGIMKDRKKFLGNVNIGENLIPEKR